MTTTWSDCSYVTSYHNTAVAPQQHNQDLKEIYIGATNSRIHHFLPQCIAFNHSFYHNALYLTRVHCATTTFNQSSLRHCARKARGCHTVVPSSFFEWIPVRKVSGNVLPWFTCTTRWKSSCLTFPTPAFVFNAVCERFTNLDAFDFRDLYRFLSKHKFSSPCAYLVAISWFDASQVDAYKDIC